MTEFNRRQILATLLASGFALAVRPVAASTVYTSAIGLKACPDEVPTASGKLPVYLAGPEKADKPLPVVIVVQEIFGVHEHIQDLCRRLAHAGYLAIAPELFFRQGDPRQYEDIQQLIRELVGKVPDAQVMSDLDAVLAWSASQGGDPQRAAITGFCWGGRITWLYAAHNPQLRAGVAWYGRLGGEPTALTPTFPLDVAARLKAPVLGLYAGRDKGISLESVEKMRSALGPDSRSKIIVYPDAEHGFNADYRPSFNATASAAAWQEMLKWFAAKGVAPR
ncbi:dienelactone hydrolase family protein [Chitinilyticum litopenaei]|uniref:dienelactone hydrolase family protein n=1 Tax=Chitinilyticum litopenaei TaxID=1121276 RepID=UPI000413BD90|nr:dienelactone hydrolase family protein [Chitinilyticum litopenaei]